MCECVAEMLHVLLHIDHLKKPQSVQFLITYSTVSRVNITSRQPSQVDSEGEVPN